MDKRGPAGPHDPDDPLDHSVDGTVDGTADGTADEMGLRFDAVWGDPGAHGDLTVPRRLARVCADLLAGGVGIGLSVQNLAYRLPLAASDDQAALAERLQFTTGEGPCMTAGREHKELAVSGAQLGAGWPVYAEALRSRTAYRSVASMPLRLLRSTLGRGALDAYFTTGERPATSTLRDVRVLARRSQDALDRSAPPAEGWTSEGWLTEEPAAARAQVWVAVGMMQAAFGLEETVALDLLRAKAYAEGISVDDLSAQLVRRERGLHDLGEPAE